MKFDINNPSSKMYAVYLDGEIEKSAIEADSDLGKVRILHARKNDWGWSSVTTEETRYGRVHIVKMEGFDMSHYRSAEVIKKYYETEEELPQTD
jgi:hypothetical protein